MRYLLFFILAIAPFSAFSQDSIWRTVRNAPGLKKGEILRVRGKDTVLVVNPMSSNPNAVQVGEDTFIVKDENTGTTEMFIEFEQMPNPPYNINQYLAQHLTYPDSLKQKNIEGRVNVGFIVHADGTISHTHIAGKSLHPVLDSIAIDVISKMPRWEPAKRYNKPLDCQFTQPVVFKSE